MMARRYSVRGGPGGQTSVRPIVDQGAPGVGVPADRWPILFTFNLPRGRFAPCERGRLAPWVLDAARDAVSRRFELVPSPRDIAESIPQPRASN